MKKRVIKKPVSKGNLKKRYLAKVEVNGEHHEVAVKVPKSVDHLLEVVLLALKLFRQETGKGVPEKTIDDAFIWLGTPSDYFFGHSPAVAAIIDGKAVKKWIKERIDA